ncbi:MAG TPA: FAD-binding oxidoreductase [Candidatus Sulfotelmatobacter sp.]|nr:FAD-binding oxidoreductase [Candidatus Sulfotelmatobacter sp.]
MDEIKNKLKASGFDGDMDDSADTLEFYSHDASMFELKPKLVVRPKDGSDVERLVKLAGEGGITLTARSAGTCMSGGAINDSVIVEFVKYFNRIEEVSSTSARAQPGVYYRDFEVATFKHGALMPTYPASRDLASIGGMVNNNSGGEKSLEFGKTQNFVQHLKFVFADGVERDVKALNKKELEAKMAQTDFEGQVYKGIYELVEANYDKIKSAKPKVTKNSTGYNLWDVWDRETEVFDLNKLIVGAQGTLGFVTDITFKLVPKSKHSGLLVLFLRDIDDLGDIINTVLATHPVTFESFDDATLYLAIRFMPSFLKILGPKRFIHLLLTLTPDALQLLKGVPKLILMVEYNGDSEDEVRDKIKSLHAQLKPKKARYEINGFEEDPTEGASEKFWIMRRYSFQLLRSKVKDKHTAPFIDDLVVPPEHLTEFLPRLRKIIKKYALNATIAGHMGDGNFHIIPLMKLEDKKDRSKILPAMKEVNNLVLSYHGSLSGEHNDGLVRGPWLEAMYGREMHQIFKKAKNIMDPKGIFNPHKKANATWDFSFSHIREHF